MDLILSSGYFAFARHLGALDALEQRGLAVDAVVGTSSGALVGALWTAGLSPESIAALLVERSPLQNLNLSPRPWRGLFSPKRLIAWLEAYLPPDFDQLEKPFAVGVCDSKGQHQLLTSGPLIEAVIASISIPGLLPKQEIAGRHYSDGGAADRLGVDPWRRWRPNNCAIVHEVARSRGTQPAYSASGLTLLRSPRANAGLTSLGNFYFQKEEANRLVAAQLTQRLGAKPHS